MKLLVHMMPWFGDGNIHRMTAYNSNNPKTITRQLDCMQATEISGKRIEGVIVTWQGIFAKFQHAAMLEINKQCTERGMLFALLIDPWCAKLGGNGPTANVIQSLHDSAVQTLINGSDYYLPEKFVLDFNSGANLSQLVAAFPEMNFLSLGSGFGWPRIDMTIADSMKRNAASIADLVKQNANTAMKIPAICKGFMDAGKPIGPPSSPFTGARDYSQSVWGGPTRVLDTQAGTYFMDTFNTLDISDPYCAVVTWNDYDEMTAIEAEASMFSNIPIV